MNLIYDLLIGYNNAMYWTNNIHTDFVDINGNFSNSC